MKFYPQRIFYLSDEMMVGTFRQHLLKSTDGGLTWSHLITIPTNFLDRLILKSGLLSRILRKGISHVLVGNQAILVVFNLKSFLIENGDVSFCGLIAGSRPLVMSTVETKFYYGEYFVRDEPSFSKIYELDCNRKTWSEVARMEKIRHIHGINYDRFDDCFWITTGDEDEEVGIWRVKRDFSSFECVLGGDQRYRAVQILFTKSHLYWGTDAPSEANKIYAMSRDSRTVSMRKEIGGPVFYGAQTDGELFFGSIVEPSKVNKMRVCELWSSIDGFDWIKQEVFKKDLWPKKLCQYGQIFFPQVSPGVSQMWITPFATTGHFKPRPIAVDQK